MKKKTPNRSKRKLSKKEIEQRRAAGSSGRGEAKAKGGSIGGSATSSAKRRTARQNAKLGGRPGNPEIKRIMQQRGVSRQRAWQIWKSQQ